MRTSPDARDAPSAQRVDKWLWFARLLKSRTLAQALAASGRIRVSRAGTDAQRITRASHLLRVGDVLTLPLGARVRVLRMCAPGVRRGPPAEARALYEDLSPAAPSVRAPEAAAPGRPKGSGRPTKRDRRALDRLKGGDI
jgi:ribosome-associated heat shock protein Hsp15